MYSLIIIKHRQLTTIRSKVWFPNIENAAPVAQPQFPVDAAAPATEAPVETPAE